MQTSQTSQNGIFFCRHAESIENTGKLQIDSPLSEKGILQATELSGTYECVIVSSLRRSKETLHYSQIKYNHLHVSPNFSERIFNECNCEILTGKQKPESDQEFFSRVLDFQNEFSILQKTYSSILLIGHSYFFNSWYRKGCYPSIEHAKIFSITFT